MKQNIFLDEWKNNFYNQKLRPHNFSKQIEQDSKTEVKTTRKLFNINQYNLQTYQRSNQDTCMVQRPAVFEGQWVKKGDLLADCSASIGGELALGQNIFVAYMPWEGYNYEDAILISERLVYDDVYTSIHIERYEVETRETKFGMEEITRQLPEIDKSEIAHLDKRGIIKIGTWVEEGKILVGKVTPTNKKYHSPYQKLLYTILEKEFLPTRDSSLRAPRGLKAKVIDIQTVNSEISKTSTPTIHNKKQIIKKLNKNNFPTFVEKYEPIKGLKKHYKNYLPSYTKWFMLSTLNLKKCNNTQINLSRSIKSKANKNSNQFQKKKTFMTLNKYLREDISFSLQLSKKLKFSIPLKRIKKITLKESFISEKSLKFPLRFQNSQPCNGVVKKQTHVSYNSKNNLNKNIQTVHIYLAEKRKIQMGDKMAGRHGNKGIVSQVLPRQDMPYLPDGTPIDMVLNPLGVPSRMNVGQIYECLLGLAGKYLGEYFRIAPFDEIYGAEASRSLVYSKLYEVRKKTGSKWIFNPNTPGKIYLYDGRTGERFDQAITVGQAYMLKLVHLVDDKIHARSTGPYSLVTQQPLRGRSKQGGQRLGEMEVWALEGYGAAFTLLEMLTIKSDDMTGRITLWSNIILNKEIYIGTPESFKVLICELQALCLDIGLFRFDSKGFLKQVEHLMKLP